MRISDLETISCIIHTRSVCDTHLCTRQSVSLSVCVIHSHGYGWPASCQSLSPDLFLTFCFYLCLDASWAASACRFPHTSFNKVTTTARVKWDLNIHPVRYAQLCHRLFPHSSYFSWVMISGCNQREGTGRHAGQAWLRPFFKEYKVAVGTLSLSAAQEAAGLSASLP